MQSDEFDWTFLARYLAGECGRGEAEAFERWLARNPARSREFEAVRLVWERASSYAHAGRAEKALDRVMARAGVERAGAVRRCERAAVRPIPGLLRIAAVLALAAIPAIFWIQRAERGGKALTEVAEAPLEEYATTRAHRATLRLPDGTRVILAPESRLVVLADFGRRERAVRLRGEAYFEVERDPERRFVVWTDGAAAEVLGTSFLVRTGREAGGTEVVVVEGRVALRAAEEAGVGLPLARGEAGRVDAVGRLKMIDGVDVASRVAWTRGHLVFHRQPFSAVVSELARWYDVTIEYPAESLSDVTVTATFDNEPLDQVLDALDRLLDITHAREGREVRFELGRLP